MVSWISGKRVENRKIWDFRGPTQRRSDPTQLRRSTLRRRVAMPQRSQEGEKGQFRVHCDIALRRNEELRRGEATVHNT